MSIYLEFKSISRETNVCVFFFLEHSSHILRLLPSTLILFTIFIRVIFKILFTPFYLYSTIIINLLNKFNESINTLNKQYIKYFYNYFTKHQPLCQSQINYFNFAMVKSSLICLLVFFYYFRQLLIGIISMNYHEVTPTH